MLLATRSIDARMFHCKVYHTESKSTGIAQCLVKDAHCVEMTVTRRRLARERGDEGLKTYIYQVVKL